MSNGKFIFLCIILFIFSIIGGVILKITHKPAWVKKYSVEFNDAIGKLYTDISYGDKELNKFDMYVPSDKMKDSYKLVVYLHAGGFTSGDKKDDASMLEWLCLKGYVAVGINYTLRTDENNQSVYGQSLEIKEAMPKVIEKAKELGYNIDSMAVSGGSAGGTLAMLYAYRDAETSPVPVKLLFEAVGPSSFHREDWIEYGLDQNKKAATDLFSVMLGKKVPEDVIDTEEYNEIIKPISAYMWINEKSVPSIIVYGKYDKICPFKTSTYLVNALKENNVDYQYFEAKHSGHGLQNDNDVFQDYMETVEEYLEKYLPVG